MFSSLLIPLGLKAARFVGLHALPHIPLLNRIPGISALSHSSINTLGAAFNVIGNRVLFGFILGGYVFNDQFAHGVNEVLGATLIRVAHLLGMTVGAVKDTIVAFVKGIF